MKAKSFGIRLFNMAAVVGILLFYNQVLEGRERDDQLARLTAQVQSLQIAADTASAGTKETAETGGYVDGTYKGEAQGFGGMIQLEVLVADGSISEISILSADGEDGAYLSMAEDIISRIIEQQSADVDTISGATFSSTGIRDAVAQALEEAE